MAERVTHLSRDVIFNGDPVARATHVTRDVIVNGQPAARVTLVWRDVIVDKNASDAQRPWVTWRG
jgi:hypothetical protein